MGQEAAGSAAADVHGAGHAVGEVKDGAAGGSLDVFGYADAEGREVEVQHRRVGDDPGGERGGVVREPLLTLGHRATFLLPQENSVEHSGQSATVSVTPLSPTWGAG